MGHICNPRGPTAGLLRGRSSIQCFHLNPLESDHFYPGNKKNIAGSVWQDFPVKPYKFPLKKRSAQRPVCRTTSEQGNLKNPFVLWPWQLLC